MKEVFDRLWEAINSLRPITVPANGDTVKYRSLNLLLDNQGEEELIFYLPPVEGVTEPSLCEFQVDHEFSRLENKDLEKKVFLATNDGTQISCWSGLGNKVLLPMVSHYNAFYVPGGTWHISDAILDTLVLQGYAITWLGGASPNQNPGMRDYIGNPDRLWLMDALVPSYHPDAHRFFISSDDDGWYSTEDEGNSTDPIQIKYFQYDSSICSIEHIWPHYSANAAPEVHGAGVNASNQRFFFSFYPTNTAAFVGPTVDTSGETPYVFADAVSRYYYYNDGSNDCAAILMLKDQSTDTFSIRYRDGDVEGTEFGSMQSFTFTDVATQGIWDELALDRKKKGVFAAMNSTRSKLVLGFTKDTVVRLTSDTFTTMLAGSAFEIDISLNIAPVGWEWKIARYDSYDGVVWFSLKRDASQHDVDESEVPLSQLFVYQRLNGGVVSEVLYWDDTDSTVYLDYEYYYDPHLARGFWLSRAIEPITGKMSIFVQEGFGNFESNITYDKPILVADQTNYDFDVACFKFMPKLEVSGGFLGMKSTTGQWAVADFDVSVLMPIVEV